MKYFRVEIKSDKPWYVVIAQPACGSVINATRTTSHFSDELIID